MSLTLLELTELRSEVVGEHQAWKRRSLTLDTMLSDRWQTIWDDLSVEYGEPLVENTLLQAIEDKTAQAASVQPILAVAPTRGTRQDRAERNAEQRRRVMKAYWTRSNTTVMLKELFMDRIGHGAAYLYPWADFYEPDGTRRARSLLYPYLMRCDPRHVYPVGHNTNKRLTSVIITKTRRIGEVEREYGRDHPALRALRLRWSGEMGKSPLTRVEETWFFDETDWAVAISAYPQPFDYAYFTYRNSYPEARTRMDEWIVACQPHGLDLCPVSESRRVTFDGEYRGELDTMVPRLKVAQSIMARFLDAVADSIYAPVVMDNIQNPEDYGPNAELIGTGGGPAKVEYPSKPVHFEAFQAARDQVDMSRRDGKHPAQRVGAQESGGWITGRGSQALMSGYDTALADAQSDVARLLQMSTMIAAHYDEVHCTEEGVKKTIEGTEGTVPFVETYNAGQLFQKDYRCEVSYGAATGLDKSQLLSQLGIARSLEGMSLRTFMEKSGMVDDALQEEREIFIENVVKAFTGTMFAQVQQGNMEPLRLALEAVDGDAVTMRQAVVDAIRNMQAPQPEPGPGNQPGPAPDGMTDINAMEAGTPVALRDAGRSLRGALPASVSQNVR